MTAGRNAGAEQLRAFMSEKLGTRHSLSYEDRRTALDAVSAALNPVPDTIQRSSESLEGIDAERFRPSDEVESRVILYLHGGAFVAGSSRSHAILTANLAKHARSQVYSVNYSLAPEHPFPAAVADCVAAYHSLLNLGHSPSQIAVAGDSAGGALALNLALVLRDAGHPLPAAIALISPATDLSQSGQSYRDFADRDPFMSISGFGSDIEAYLGEADRSLGSASPLSADLSGLPPLLIHVGSEEILLDDALGLARRAAEARVKVELEIWPDMPHAWHLFPNWLPEATAATIRIARFFSKHCQWAASDPDTANEHDMESV